ncbi:PHA/PHB synthase family protein [Cognatiyoonia sp. IB215182]|uniref:PHA/PHB synthase family protein n=1 Tax=Cognatiyoonia sp. IB215182 TaxID=3097353 RepID=UPI002A0B5102|nr:alpha/beta fold hydrolase [Cognatiyoonia sp. IB215182]MDX8354991.1 alpha/beta fold hydrolase [Cognatiyoonia sp. IB215182]
MTQTQTAHPVPAVIPRNALARHDVPSVHSHRNLDRAIRAAVAKVTGGISPHAVTETWFDWALHLSRAPGRQLELIERAQTNAARVAAFAMGAWSRDHDPAAAPFAPKTYDHRFADPAWDNPPFNLFKQGFLAVQDWWDHATDDIRGLQKQDTDRAKFQIRQMLDLVSPSNFPLTNPEIIAATMAENGQNLVAGSAHFTSDLIQTITQQHKPAPEGFQIGKDLACTPGKVVFRNDLFELIQYSPQTATTYPEPILFVPAWIMKYYVLDLSPHNSMVKYLVDQGFTVFMISWCNPTADQADLSLEDYRKRGVLAALDVINAIMPDRRVHANGYCLGGTLLSIAAATMARDGDHRLASVTLMAAQVDFDQAGELLLFVDESQVAFVEDMMWEQGYLDRPQMTRTFASIRAEDLIYTRAVNRYFLGKEDLPSDLLVWNGDTTRMPARMHSEYLRGLFLENRLTSGRFAVEGRVIALKDIDLPLFVIATETDHIAPWRSVYKTRLFTDCDLTFVLTNGGHNGGILSEPGHKGRHFRMSDRPRGAHYMGPDDWVAEHEEADGSWWPAYADWLRQQSGRRRKPPAMGTQDHGALADAPGAYIHQT